MPANSAEPLGVHGINPVGNTYCGFLSGLRVLHKYRSDLIEHPALARRRERGNVAHAPHPIDDIVVSAVLDVEERAFRPPRPVGVVWPGQVTLGPMLGVVGRTVSIPFVAPGRVS